MNGTYTHPPGLTVKERFWLINPVQGKEPTDLHNETGYSDRVQNLTDEQNHFSLRLSDVKKTDEHMYYFRITTNEKKEIFQGYPGVTLTVTDRPKRVSVSISPSGEIVEGRTVTLTCSSEANPPVKSYTWYKGRTSLGKKKTYTISKISSEDSGEYKCKCSNEVGHQDSNSVTLNVLYPPKNVSVSISLSGEIVEGRTVTLTCSSEANPPVKSYTWYKGSTSLGKEKTYTISKISSGDSGEYKCKCSNEVGHQDSNSVTLNVLYPPKNVSVSISLAGEIVEGRTVTLTCSNEANPPVKSYTWYKGRTSLGKKKTYTISKISSGDSGEYKCKCSNEVGHQDSNSVTLNVLYPPKNVSVSISLSGEIVEGRTVTLNCSSDANPPVQNYTWFKEKESSPVGSGQSYRAVQSGQYYCEAQNKHGSERSAAVSVTVNDGSVIVYVAVGLGLFGLAALLSALFWLRSKRQKKKADEEEGDYQNIGPSAQDDTYANVELLQTHAFSLPTPPADASTSPDYENIASRDSAFRAGNSLKDSKGQTVLSHQRGAYTPRESTATSRTAETPSACGRAHRQSRTTRQHHLPVTVTTPSQMR
ncbi:hypothetical protein QTP70_002571 [Hemibagrus guttatus]|uniref:Ig-like domain-containing protein n=1 Tax=Hemibagrus guttatus TaxID=175788 RepID=A0AAE0PYX2_9TELE|nr:hypothetical protein QTP70_002571 [Hemibagrus guttatus]